MDTDLFFGNQNKNATLSPYKSIYLGLLATIIHTNNRVTAILAQFLCVLAPQSHPSRFAQ